MGAVVEAVVVEAAVAEAAVVDAVVVEAVVVEALVVQIQGGEGQGDDTKCLKRTHVSKSCPRGRLQKAQRSQKEYGSLREYDQAGGALAPT